MAERYATYNSGTRPGIGVSLLGEEFYNCFTFAPSRNPDGTYRPYLLTDFLREWDAYPKASSVCLSCIQGGRCFTFPVDGRQTDRTAVVRRFHYGEARESDYYYCPHTSHLLSESSLELIQAGFHNPGEGVEPLPLCWDGGGDNDYFLRFQSFGKLSPNACPILKDAGALASTEAERRFWDLWFSSISQAFQSLLQSRRDLYFQEKDFDQRECIFYRFAYPIPQVWVQVIPPRAHDEDYRDWRANGEISPQRVDFMIVAGGKRHVIEIDGPTHFGSEEGYVKTLRHTRRLQASGYVVHRFGNSEILNLNTQARIGEAPPIFGELGMEVSDVIQA